MTSSPGSQRAFAGAQVPPAGGFGGVQPAPTFSTPAEVRIPLWEDGIHAPTAKLKIQRQTAEGNREDLGTIPPDADEGNLLAHVEYKPGTYLVFPVDEFGRHLRADPYKRVFPPDHPLIRSRQASGGGAGLVYQGPPPVDPFLLLQQMREMVQAELEGERSRLALREQALEAERASLQKQREAVTTERMGLAMTSTNAVMEQTEKMNQAHDKRTDQALKSVVDTFSQQLALAKQDAEIRANAAKAEADAKIALIKAEADARLVELKEKTRLEELRLKAEETRLAAERKANEQRLEDAKQEAERKAKQARDEAKLEADERRQRDQEFYKSLAEVHKRDDPLKAVQGLVAVAATLIPQVRDIFGLPDPREKAEKVEAEAAESRPKTLAEVVGGVLQTWMTTQAKVAMIQAGVDDDEEGEEEEDEDPTGRPQLTVVPAPQPVPGSQPSPGPVATVGGLGQAGVVPGSHGMAELSARIADRTQHLPPDVQKAARRAVRAFLPQVVKTPEDQRVMLIGAMLQAEPALGPYFMAVGIRSTLIEGGATGALADEVVRLVEASGLVPPEVPRY